MKDPRARNETVISHAMQQQAEKEKMQKLASPYAIRNLTDKPISVFTIDKQGVVLFLEPEVVQPD